MIEKLLELESVNGDDCAVLNSKYVPVTTVNGEVGTVNDALYISYGRVLS